jgi:hypothetical protein
MYVDMDRCTYLCTAVCMYAFLCMYVSTYPTSHLSIHPSIHPSIHAAEDLDTWSHPPLTTKSPQNQETHMHQTARAGREGQNTRNSNVTSLLQLVHQDTESRQLVCYSWYYCLKYQGIEYKPFATAGTSGHNTNGVSHIQLAHQATLTMESVTYS